MISCGDTGSHSGTVMVEAPKAASACRAMRDVLWSPQLARRTPRIHICSSVFAHVAETLGVHDDLPLVLLLPEVVHIGDLLALNSTRIHRVQEHQQKQGEARATDQGLSVLPAAPRRIIGAFLPPVPAPLRIGHGQSDRNVGKNDRRDHAWAQEALLARHLQHRPVPQDAQHLLVALRVREHSWGDFLIIRCRRMNICACNQQHECDISLVVKCRKMERSQAKIVLVVHCGILLKQLLDLLDVAPLHGPAQLRLHILLILRGQRGADASRHRLRIGSALAPHRCLAHQALGGTSQEGAHQASRG
mmetsp:Transcript_122348/g.391423  ORF Transcript_122348/g.391423 Transcript_122348/m.391423 type:complete len:304 (+) Transcript_122348:758-1669(+)